MKRIIIYILMAIITIPAMAQSNRNRSFNQRLFNAKVEQIAKSLNLSEERKERFIPIYKAYSEEMIKVWNELGANSKDGMEQMKSNMTDQRMKERQKRSYAVRMKYTERFATVLTPAEIRKFYQVENEIQRRLKERRYRKR